MGKAEQRLRLSTDPAVLILGLPARCVPLLSPEILLTPAKSGLELSISANLLQLGQHRLNVGLLSAATRESDSPSTGGSSGWVLA